MGQISDNLKTFALLAGAIGIVQGSIWLTFSILAIVSYNVCEFSEADSVLGIFWNLIQRAYFMGPSCVNSLQETFEVIGLKVLRPYQLLVWSSIYVGVSSLWIIISGLVIKGTISRRVNNFLLSSYFMWSFLTLGISGLDIALGVMFALDYESFATHYEIFDSLQGVGYLFLSAGSFTLMTIMLRGFVALLINMSLAIYLFIQAFNLQKENVKLKHNIYTHGPLHAYDSSTEPRHPWNLRRELERPTASAAPRSHTGHSDLAFIPTSRNSSAYEPSNSWHEVKVNQQRPKIQHEPLKGSNSSPRAAESQQIAVSAVSPHVLEPYTPAPDYSPPPIRQTRLKPTLKQHFRY